jgi:hypothetical protein
MRITQYPPPEGGQPPGTCRASPRSFSGEMKLGSKGRDQAPN